MGKFSVVLLDDDGEDMSLLKDSLLENSGFVVLAVCTSYELLQLVLEDLEDTPDAIVCDIYMEKKDGLAVCRELHASGKYADTAFFLITGTLPASSIVSEAEDNAIQAVFLKPDTMAGYALLTRRLKSILEKAQAASPLVIPFD